MKCRRNLYVACEELNFVFDEDEARKFDQLWRQGHDITDIAKTLKRKVDEIAILAIDRLRKKNIKPRPGGACGWLNFLQTNP